MKRNTSRFFLLVASALFLFWSFTACLSTGIGQTPEPEPGFTTPLPAEAPDAYPVADGDPLSADFSRSSTEFVRGLKAGWNLGNTLDAVGNWEQAQGLNSETCWGQPKTTQAMMRGLKESGISLVRIPVSWHNHVDAAFTIDSAWMARVKEVVDYAIDEGLYVILNTHHDNEKDFYYPDAYYEGRSVEYSRRIWKQIALQFKNYDEKLIFEILNEPRLAGDPLEWGWNNSNQNYKKAAEVISAMEAAALTEIRASGGNNENRYVMITPYAASTSAALSPHFALPKDNVEDKIIVSVHAYSPYSFAMQNPGDKTFTENHKREISTIMKNLNDTFVSKGIAVIIGEYGATNKNNLDERVKWFSHYCGTAASYGIPTVLWDNGGHEVPVSGSFEELYGYYNRKNQTWYFPELLAAILEAYDE